MSRVLLGFVTFGNSMFTEKMIESVKNTCTYPIDFFGIIGKPGDGRTHYLLESLNIPYYMHTENKGFPSSVNDIYDYGFKEHDYDYIIFAGNDIIAYPYAIDSLISIADSTDYTAISTQEINVKSLVEMYPEVRQFFSGGNYVTNDLSHKAWEKFTGYSDKIEIIDSKGIIDIHNLCLYKKEVFEKAGYIDVNFFPAYYEDNDYVRRMGLVNLKSCTINAKYFHFWSRTIHQENGGSNSKFFGYNQNFYIAKWGGMPNHEKYTIPFNGIPYKLLPELDVPIDINIQRRDLEPYFINYWRQK